MRIQYEGLVLPVSRQLADALSTLINQNQVMENETTINFRDPSYSAE